MTRMRIDQKDIRDADIFENLLDNFPDIIHSVDDEGRIVYANRTAETLLGYSTEELLSMNVRQIYAEEVLRELEAGFVDLKERGDKRVESILKDKKGNRIPVEIRSFSIYDDSGNFLRTFSILRDIRPIKDLQNSLVHAGRLAAIGELASGVAHDINNPLTVILLSNEMLLRETGRAGASSADTLKRLQAYAQDVQKASKSIQKLADHLRNFSRGIAEKHETVDLHNVIADALFISQNKTRNCNIAVDNRIAKGRHFVVGCPNRIEQVFVNLITNACDAMKERPERKLVLEATACDRDGIPSWKCDVSDTGSGIPPELYDEIFRSFFTTKGRGDGTGLGLSIARGIARDHKGDITVASEVGKGTTFSVCLPRAG